MEAADARKAKESKTESKIIGAVMYEFGRRMVATFMRRKIQMTSITEEHEEDPYDEFKDYWDAASGQQLAPSLVKKARQEEIESLQEALKILSGDDIAV